MRCHLGNGCSDCGGIGAVWDNTDYDAMADYLAQSDATLEPAVTWPKARDVGRLGDMSPSAHLRVGLDSDNDAYVSVWDDKGGTGIEFCTPGGGGGKSSRTRMALIALMVAMEADNADMPALDWWALRGAPSQAPKGGA